MNLRLQPECRQLKRRGRCAPVRDLESGNCDAKGRLESPLGRSVSRELAMESGGELVELSSDDTEAVREGM